MPVTISGLASDIDTEGIIHKLVEVEKIPLRRLEEEKKLKCQEKKVWKLLKEELVKLNDITKELYGFRSIFKDKKAINNEFFTLTPTRNAKKSKHKIEILSLAKSHKILTDPISFKETLPGSIFEISVGEEKRVIKGFKKGGTPQKLVDVLNKEAGDLIDAQIIKADKNNVIISIEAKNTGEKNRINLRGKRAEDEKLFKKIGLFSKPVKNFLSLNFDDKKPADFNFILNGYNNTISALIKTKQSREYRLDSPLENIKDGKIEFVYNLLPVKKKPLVDKSGKIVKKNIGNVAIKDVIIYGADVILNRILKREKKGEKKFKSPIIELYDTKGNVQTISLEFTNKWRKFSDKIEIEPLTKIVFKNFSDYDMELDNLKITAQTKGKKFKNVVQEPSDAQLKMDGVLIKRDKNEDLNDVINGVTLNLKQETTKPIIVEIREDVEKINEKVNKFVEQYNKIIEFISEAGKTSKSTRPGEYKKEDRGILSNDISLMNLQSKLRATVVSSYKTSLGNRLAMLAQIGISTGKWGSVWADIRKGTLKIDEDKFNTALAQFGEKVGELFGYDSNGDKIIDTGVAYTLVNVLKPYTAPKGVIDGKISLAELMIRSTEKRIAKKEEEIEKYKKSLKRKFGKMESTLQQLKGMSQTLENSLGNLNFETGGGKKKKGEKE